MMLRRRWLTSCALAVFFIAVIGYLFWIPYDPASLYRAIPADAALVSSHQNLAQRWPQLATNIWLNPLLGTEETSGQTSDPNTLRSVSRLIQLARRDTLFAYLPTPGGTGKPTWMAVSWIGGWSPCVRWALYWGRWSGSQWPIIKELGTFGSRTMWGLQTPLADGQRLSFACGDGVLLACLSPDPAAIRYVLMAYDGLIPSTRVLAELRKMPEPVSPDVAWGQWQGTNAEKFTLTGALTRFDDQGLSATIRLQPSPYRQVQLADSINIAAVEQALGNLPALVMALPLPTLQDGLCSTTTESTWLQTIRRILQSDWIQQDTNGLVLALFTGEYGGGYGRKPLRLSIPALMAFIRVRQPESIRRMIGRELDLLNARHRLGLIQDPIPLTVGSQAIWTIEITSNNTLAALEAEDRPAYTLVGDWLIVSSQAGSLAKLIRRFQKLGNETPLTPEGWHGAMSAKNTSGLVWLDLDAGGKTVQLALSLWGLSQRTADTPSMPHAIKAVRTLLDQIRPLQSCTLWMEPEGSNAVVHVEIGPRAEP
ncbi:MAG: hypothetical protein KJ964_05450 [Verrucomicrobia bacterium]|nr:hypothetical protein [Verrucomicrobiota bacterium]MBU1856242.1 hypothetical protein [Verrucomicrobiota bacterium]